jgi:hypothetical protein
LKLEILKFSLPTGRIFVTKPGNVNGGQFVIEANDCKPSQYNFISHARTHKQAQAGSQTPQIQSQPQRPQSVAHVLEKP